jgi:hypothetical protein
VHFNASVTVPPARYGDLTLNTGGSVKTLAPGVTRVDGDLTIAEGVKVEGAVDGSSALELSGNIIHRTSDPFAPANPFSLVFAKDGAQQYEMKTPLAAFDEIRIGGNTTVTIGGEANSGTLQLGSETGGGIIIDRGGKLILRNRELVIAEKGSVNRAGQEGELGFRNSAITIASASDANSNLYTITGMDSVSRLTVDATGTGRVTLHKKLYVIDHVNPLKGHLESNGFLSLVSTRARTARVLKSSGGGKIDGEVVFQRFIGRGKQTRYISFPVAGVSVSELQAFVPVSGQFNGASTGAGAADEPSLHYFDEPSGGWIPFPRASNAEILETGRGYSILIPHETRDSKIALSGPIYQGDREFMLTPNATNDPQKGWNLIGNPYPSPIEWNAAGWARNGTASAAYVLDDRYPGGRFLVWDGETGDPAFAGVIAQGQAFFVRSASAEPALVVTEEAKTDLSAHLWRQKETKSYSGLLVITLEQDSLTDHTYVKFSDSGDNGFDARDAVKRRNGYFSLSTLSDDSVALAINDLAESRCDRAVAAGVDANPGTYALRFDKSGLSDPAAEIRLLDRHANKTVDLKPGEAYTFEITNDPHSSGKQRFAVQMPSGSLVPVITVTEGELTSNVSSGNQWLLNGDDIPGATGQSLVPEAPGEYAVRVTINGCTKTSKPVSVTTAVTGIAATAGGEVMIYPNPATDYIHVRLGAAEAQPTGYAIFNHLGARVALGEWSAGGRIAIGALAPGIYFLDIQSGRARHSRKFVVGEKRP